MAGFPVFTVSQLSNYSGRPLKSYPAPYSDQALIQATVIFMIITELRNWPECTLDQTLATMGILQYADTLILEQPYQQVSHNPFQSQTIGSTSYSKPVAYIRGNAQANALKGEQTGLPFFDLAVQKLALRTEFGGVYGAADTMSFHSGEGDVWVEHDHITGTVHITGPADRNRQTDIWGQDFNAENYPAEENPSGYGMSF